MSKSDTWPSHIALESLSNMDSAGSCDSVISMNSGYSEDSMEHLSPEERACLMYLQETIEALEVQDDSGLSNEEPDHGSFADKIENIRVKDSTSLRSDDLEKDQQSLLSSDLPTMPSLPAEEPATTTPTVENNTENHVLNHSPEPQSSSASADGAGGLDTVDLPAEAVPPAPDVALPPSAPKMNATLLPPPSDFMDKPNSSARPERVKYFHPSVPTSSSKPGVTVDVEQVRQRAITPTVNLEQLCHRAAIRKSSLGPSLSEEYRSKPLFDMPPSFTPPPPALGLPVNSSPPLSPLPENPEPKTPPAVAPKPKRLPGMILLKSQKTAAAPPSSDVNSGYLAPPSSDRTYLDHQKVRMEALRKLGLLKSEEGDPGASRTPKYSPKTRRSWAAPSPPISPASSNTPPPTPSNARVHSQPLASVRPLSVSPAALLLSATSAAPRAPSPEILPAPPAFSDCTDSLPSDGELSPVGDVPDSMNNHKPLTPSALIKQLSPPRAKSTTLERSGLGLSSYLASQNIIDRRYSRNGRPRTASLGGKKDFLSPEEEDAEAEEDDNDDDDDDGSEPDMWVSLPPPSAPSKANDSHKLPRSHGVSVLISPRAENEEDRREALRKLGLLRD